MKLRDADGWAATVAANPIPARFDPEPEHWPAYADMMVAGCDDIHLTEPMELALRVVHRHDGRARRSNITDEDGGLVYWQSAARIVLAGLATFDGSIDAHLDLTPLGTRVMYALEEAAGR